MSYSLLARAPSAAEILDGIGRAFSASFEREGTILFGVFAVLCGVALVVVLVRWVTRESDRDLTLQAELDARHETALADASQREDARRWARVPARLRMTVQRKEGRERLAYEECETVSVSGGSVEYLSHAPPVEGMPVQFSIDFREKWPLALRGIVARVDPSYEAGSPSLVVVKLGPIKSRDRDRIVRWVAREQVHNIAEARKGRVCSCCHRPIADDAGDMHPTCKERISKATVRSAAV